MARNPTLKYTKSYNMDLSFTKSSEKEYVILDTVITIYILNDDDTDCLVLSEVINKGTGTKSSEHLDTDYDVVDKISKSSDLWFLLCNISSCHQSD